MPAPPTSKQQQSIKSPANAKASVSSSQAASKGKSGISGTGSSGGGLSGGSLRGTGGGGGSVNAAAANASRILNSKLGAGTGGSSNLPVSRPFSYAGPKGALSLTPAARFASVGGVGMMPRTPASASDLNEMARMMLAESSSIRNPLGGISTGGLQGVGEVIRNRVLSDKFPDTVPGVLNQKDQFTPVRDGSIKKYSPSSPGYQAAYDVARAIMSGEQAPSVGNSLNYANLATVNSPKDSQASAATKRGFNAMTPVSTVVSAKNPAMQHSFGSWGDQSDVQFASAPQTMQPQTASYQAPASMPQASQSSGLLGDLWNTASTTAQNVFSKAKPAVDTINSLPGTPDQKAAIVNAYATGGKSAAASKYLETLMQGLGGSPFDYGHATPERAAEERGGNGSSRQAESNIQKLTPEQQLETLSLEKEQRVLLEQYMKSGMSFDQAIKVIRGGGQTAGTPPPTTAAPWQFPTMINRPYTRIA